LEGEKVTVEIRGEDHWMRETSSEWELPHELLPLDGLAGHVRGAFQPTRVNVQLNYDAKDPGLIFNLGLEPDVYNLAKTSKLSGNYGVLHDLVVHLRNSAKTTRQVQLFCVPSGGLARGLFIIDQDFLETGVLDPHQDDTAALKIVSLPPGSERTLWLTTLPQSGSYYPLRLVFVGS
jgi:hypothetical protein